MSKTKRTFRIVLIVIILLVPLSLVLKSIIKKKIEQEIEHFNDTHPISITYSNLNLSFLAGNSTIESLKIVRDSVDGAQNVPLSQHPHIYVGKIKIRGLSVSSLIFDKKIDLNKIIIQDVEMVYYEKEKKLNQEEEKEASLDSIRFKGLEGFSLGVFEIDRYQIVMLNKASDTLTNLVGQSFEIDLSLIHI